MASHLAPILAWLVDSEGKNALPQEIKDNTALMNDVFQLADTWLGAIQPGNEALQLTAFGNVADYAHPLDWAWIVDRLQLWQEFFGTTNQTADDLNQDANATAKYDLLIVLFAIVQIYQTSEAQNLVFAPIYDLMVPALFPDPSLVNVDQVKFFVKKFGLEG